MSKLNICKRLIPLLGIIISGMITATSNAKCNPVDTVYALTEKSANFLQQFFITNRFDSIDVSYTVGEITLYNGATRASLVPRYNTQRMDYYCDTLGLSSQSMLDSLTVWRTQKIPDGNAPRAMFVHTLMTTKCISNYTGLSNQEINNSPWTIPDRSEFLLALCDPVTDSVLVVLDSVGVDSSRYTSTTSPMYGTNLLQTLVDVSLPSNLAGRHVRARLLSRRFGNSPYGMCLLTRRNNYSAVLSNPMPGVIVSDSIDKSLLKKRFDLLLASIQNSLDLYCKFPNLSHLNIRPVEMDSIRARWMTLDSIVSGRKFYSMVLCRDSITPLRRETGIEMVVPDSKMKFASIQTTTDGVIINVTGGSEDSYYTCDVFSVSGQRMCSSAETAGSGNFSFVMQCGTCLLYTSRCV